MDGRESDTSLFATELGQWQAKVAENRVAATSDSISTPLSAHTAGGGTVIASPYVATAAPSRGRHDAAILLSPPAYSGDTFVVPLCQPMDANNLSTSSCLLREQIEVFSATAQDNQDRPVHQHKPFVGKVGFRCIHCLHIPYKMRARGAVMYPNSIDAFYQASRNFKRYHIAGCAFMPASIKKAIIKPSQTKREKLVWGTRQYWTTSCLYHLGLVEVDTTNEGPGIIFNGSFAGATTVHAGRVVFDTGVAAVNNFAAMAEKNFAAKTDWAQCDNCNKWHALPTAISPKDLPQLWYCHMMNWDSAVAGCAKATTHAGRVVFDTGVAAVNNFAAMAEMNFAAKTDWAQCDNCNKWHALPTAISPKDLPQLWYCHMMNWDSAVAGCAKATTEVITDVQIAPEFVPSSSANGDHNDITAKDAPSTSMIQTDDINDESLDPIMIQPTSEGMAKGQQAGVKSNITDSDLLLLVDAILPNTFEEASASVLPEFEPLAAASAASFDPASSPVLPDKFDLLAAAAAVASFDQASSSAMMG